MWGDPNTIKRTPNAIRFIINNHHYHQHRQQQAPPHSILSQPSLVKTPNTTAVASVACEFSQTQ